MPAPTPEQSRVLLSIADRLDAIVEDLDVLLLADVEGIACHYPHSGITSVADLERMADRLALLGGGRLLYRRNAA